MVEIRLYDDDGNIVTGTGPEATGELYVRSPAVFADYYKQHDKFEEDHRDGFQTVGDIAYRDDEGFLYICDRKKDMIISGGMNIYPAEIESALEAHPDIYEAAVFGIPSDDWGELVHAVIVKRPGSDLDEDGGAARSPASTSRATRCRVRSRGSTSCRRPGRARSSSANCAPRTGPAAPPTSQPPTSEPRDCRATTALPRCVPDEPRLTIHASAPTRICDNGGWTDTWFAEYGTVFSIAIEPRVHVEMTARPHDGSRPRVLSMPRCSATATRPTGSSRGLGAGTRCWRRRSSRSASPRRTSRSRSGSTPRAVRCVDRHVGRDLRRARRRARRARGRERDEPARRRPCRVARRDGAAGPAERRPGPDRRRVRRDQPDPRRPLPERRPTSSADDVPRRCSPNSNGGSWWCTSAPRTGRRRSTRP